MPSPTRYFTEQILRKRPYLTLAMCGPSLAVRCAKHLKMMVAFATGAR